MEKGDQLKSVATMRVRQHGSRVSGGSTGIGKD